MLMLHKLYAYGAGAIVVIAAIGWASHVRYQAGYEAAEAVMAQKVALANAQTEAAENAARQRVEEVDNDYQSKLQDLDAKYRDAVGRIGPVRLCGKPASRSALPSDPTSAGSGHGSTSGNELPAAPRDDIGPDLVELARLADKQTQQLVACQAFVRALEPHGQPVERP